MYKVIKRDGTVADFDISKVRRAIIKAFESVDRSYTDDIIDFIVLKVTADFEKKIHKEPGILGKDYKYDTINVEDIQDSVETVLVKSGYDQVAKSFILYRDKHAKLRCVKNTLIDYKKTVEGYLGGSDWRVKENSTVNYSVGGLILNQSGAVTANYWLSEIYDAEIANAHRNCDMHIHDLCMLAPYCCGHNLRQLIKDGLNGVPDKIASAPAGHLSTLCNQMVNYLGIMQNEWAGAQAFSSFDTLLAPFVKKDNLSYKEVKQCIQSFIYGVNTPSRWGTQAPFSNVTIDWNCPDDLKDLPAVVGGKEQDFTYGDCKAEQDMINKAFMEIMMEGDYNGRGFQYPIPTYSITKGFDWTESENLKMLFEMAAKYGIPYFSNYVNSDMNPSDVRSMCPLTGDTLLLAKSYKGTSVQPIAQLYKQQAKSADQYPYQVWTGSSWDYARVNKQDPTEVLEITFSNGVTEKLGINHLQPIITPRGIATLRAEELKEGMDVPFNICAAKGEMLGTYELGYVVGAYLGDGSHDDDGIVYSLSRNKRNDAGVLVSELVYDFFTRLGFKVSIKESTDSGLVSVRVGQGSFSLINRFFEGTDALTKKLNRTTFTMSVEFRNGLLNGFQDTDGSQKSHRFYTSSLELRDSMCHLLASLGYKYRKGYVDTRDNRISPNSKPNYRVDYTTLRCFGEYYRQAFGYSLVRIESIKRVENRDPLYCMEVDNDEHLFMLASGLITHNCRLRLDLREIVKKKGGGFFGSGDKTGSVGVVTLNFARLGYLAADESDFYKRLDNLLDIAARSLHVKRTVLTQLLDQGLYPYTKRYIGSFDTYFSTIATVGMNEMCLNAKWIKAPIHEKAGQQFTMEVLQHILDRLPNYQEQYGALFNLESAPAESTCYRLAKHDKEKYPDIITAGTTEVPYYTNSSNIAVGHTSNIYEALEIQDPIQILYTSGTVFHTYLGERLPDWKSAATIIKKICENYRLPYITLSPTFSICPEHGYIKGEHYTCPVCMQEQSNDNH